MVQRNATKESSIVRLFPDMVHCLAFFTMIVGQPHYRIHTKNVQYRNMSKFMQAYGREDVGPIVIQNLDLKFFFFLIKP